MYKVPTAQSKQTIETTFFEAQTKIRVRAQKVIMEETIRTKKVTTQGSLASAGRKFRYDDFEYWYEIHLPKFREVSGNKMKILWILPDQVSSLVGGEEQ